MYNSLYASKKLAVGEVVRKTEQSTGCNSAFVTSVSPESEFIVGLSAKIMIVEPTKSVASKLV